MDAFFELAGWAMRLFGWVLGVFLALSIGCAAVYIVAWGVLWHAMGW